MPRAQRWARPFQLLHGRLSCPCHAPCFVVRWYAAAPEPGSPFAVLAPVPMRVVLRSLLRAQATEIAPAATSLETVPELWSGLGLQCFHPTMAYRLRRAQRALRGWLQQPMYPKASLASVSSGCCSSWIPVAAPAVAAKETVAAAKAPPRCSTAAAAEMFSVRVASRRAAVGAAGRRARVRWTPPG